jgi:hypothetical protein
MTRDSGRVPDAVTRVTLERAREAVGVLRDSGHPELAEAIEALTCALEA